jgi:hypothetical protein
MPHKSKVSPAPTVSDKRKPMVILPVERHHKANLFSKKEPGKVVVLKPGTNVATQSKVG